MRGFLQFAAEEGSGPHISLAPENIFTVGGVPISNSIIYGAFTALLIAVFFWFVGRKSGIKVKSKMVQMVELTVEFIIDMLTNVLGSREKAIKYAPLYSTIFIFITINNIMGLMPVVGTGVNVGGTPVFRPFTADLNGTLALAIIAIIAVQIMSIRESGIIGHLKHYFTDKPYNPIFFFIGVLEVFGELTRIMSLALRLFLNTAVGEILIAVFGFIGASFGSFTILPVAVFEILVALVQAYVFTILTAAYLGQAIAHGPEEHGEHPVDHPSPELKVEGARG